MLSRSADQADGKPTFRSVELGQPITFDCPDTGYPNSNGISLYLSMGTKEGPH